MIWAILAVIVAFIVGFAIAAEIGRIVYNQKMTEIQNIADNLNNADLIKHFDKTHFTALTVGNRKFLYCPVGNICSWSEGDYDHNWCHYCQKYFSEIATS